VRCCGGRRRFGGAGGLGGEVLADRGAALVELAAKCPAVGGADGLDVLEREGLAGVLGADGSAQEPVAVEHQVADRERHDDIAVLVLQRIA